MPGGKTGSDLQRKWIRPSKKACADDEARCKILPGHLRNREDTEIRRSVGPISNL